MPTDNRGIVGRRYPKPRRRGRSAGLFGLTDHSPTHRVGEVIDTEPAIAAILKVQELHAQADIEIEAIQRRQDAKFEEIVALLAAQENLGDLATLTANNRNRLEIMADQEFEHWRRYKLSTAKPNNELERLCKEYQDFSDEISCRSYCAAIKRS